MTRCAFALFPALLLLALVCRPGSVVHADAASARRGAEIFATHGCAFCHGPQMGGTERAPSLQEVSKRLKADQIEHQIHDGGKGMPAFGDQLTAEEIADLVSLLRSKHPERLLPSSTSPAPR